MAVTGVTDLDAAVSPLVSLVPFALVPFVLGSWPFVLGPLPFVLEVAAGAGRGAIRSPGRIVGSFGRDSMRRGSRGWTGAAGSVVEIGRVSGTICCAWDVPPGWAAGPVGRDGSVRFRA